MHALMNAVLTGATGVADALADLLDNILIGFGQAAPLIAPGEDYRLEDPRAPTP
ncbi:hypothetical protein [Methylobacterium pseudosasicola]|uniref:Uncharacterized protein n=1 Tax=Methylobacterium pseudosasicola TaxID=582667 RepID=A0A1I4M4N2_9HYPH|nr:hypothetical protein [Methylobacterium pseudosasicola]SFL98181.1 hypothetical protein SAMN05192568_101599 [Methylobacterium pseudosasicola]